MKKPTVVVAMSGGVDSSLAAALLKDSGYDVVGVTMDVFSLPKEVCRSETLHSCCGQTALLDANRVATHLRIPHYVLDLRKDFEKWVVKDFCDEYARGRTPNPCIRCNTYIKFEALWKRAQKLGADFVATGHHARVERDLATDEYLLLKGKDRDKDQSYFLYTITQAQLARTLMPIGELTKKDVRKKAKDYGLPVHEKPESQEICFIPDNNRVRFLREKIPSAFRPGPIVDARGRNLGTHPGIPCFTIGQRRGLGISAPRPLYVMDILPETETIVVGERKDLLREKAQLSCVNLIGKTDQRSFRARAKIRYKHREARATVTLLREGRAALLEFESPQRAITPGQAAVFYRGERVIGGGIIEATSG
ncbi:MAG: tRNA 2-thiouridine(34) synthase MnmA [Candidatus Aminicenantales bacterium]